MRKKLLELINQLEVQIYEPLYNQKYYDKGHWDYVSYSHDNFIQDLKQAYHFLGEAENLKFIDIGCGIGTKVLIASQFFQASGIELNQNYFKIARKVNAHKKFHKFGRYEKLGTKNNIINGDAFEHDYSKYDVLYFFRPMNKEQLQIRLEKKIFKEMKVGAVIIPIYHQSEFPDYIQKVRQTKNLYVKK